PEQDRVRGVLSQQPVGTAVAVWKDRLCAECLGHPTDRRDDGFEGFIPRHARELTAAFRTLAHHREPQPVVAVSARRKPSNLRADIATRRVVGIATVALDDAAVADAHRQAAGVGAIERAGGGHLYVG